MLAVDHRVEVQPAEGAMMSTSGALEPQYNVAPTGLFPWWLVLIEGIAAVIIGVLLLLAPQATLELVLQLFALYWVVDGVLRLASAFTDPVDRGLKIAMGSLGVLAGIAVIRHPLWLAVALTFMLVALIGFAGVAIGVLSFIQASRGGGWGAAIVGVLSLLFGLIVLVHPFLSGDAWGYFYAGASLIGGLVAIVMAFRMRASSRAAEPVAGGQAASSDPT
jgi:uncharacterized membrane protein HdeD (DUF308 family)